MSQPRQRGQRRLSAVLGVLRPAGAPEAAAAGRSRRELFRSEFAAAAARGRSLGNRGPLELGADGRLPAAVLEAYGRTGFYVFERAIAPAELARLQREVEGLLASRPAAPGSSTDARGGPCLALVPGTKWAWAKPLSDPDGRGVDTYAGADDGLRPPLMREHCPAPGSPPKVVKSLLGWLPMLPSGPALYGHPRLLAAAASVNGPDFVPFGESIQIKLAHLGPSVAWQ
jgi:hypothetical protein